MKYEKLFEPLVTPKITLKNRFVVPAMETNLGGVHGEITPELIGYWEARAKGGFGLLVLENSSVDPAGNVTMHTPGFYDETQIDNLKLLPEAVHAHGAKIAAQICHVGRQTLPSIINQQPFAPSPIPDPMKEVTPKELTHEEIDHIVDQFALAARIVKASGFDAVEIHGAHGYLIAEFMSGYINKRQDEYGGDLRGRMKFALRIVERVRQVVGPDYPIMFRISADEHIPTGRGISETMLVARMLEEAGVDILDISSAVGPSDQFISAPAAIPRGYMLGDAEAVRNMVSIAVIAVGRLNEPDLAEWALEAGKADLIAIGRGSLADPEYPNKVRDGRLDDITPCLSCNQGCYKAFPKPGSDAFQVFHTTCIMNPFCCEETKMVIQPAAEQKKVVVVGGGPAGLCAAWIAAAQGHSVTLFEKADRLGGQIFEASIPPYKQDLTLVTITFRRRCLQYGVDIRLNTEATEELILQQNPDAVILATGAEPFVPDIPGIDNPKIVTARELLRGEVVCGQRVLIVGGNMVGVETADFLGENHRQVTVAGRNKLIARDVSHQSLPMLMERLGKYGVQLLTEAEVVRFTEDGVVINHAGQEEVLSGFDTMVLAIGYRSTNPLEAQLTGKVPQLFVIGDAKKARSIMEATEEAAKAALAL